MASRFVPFRLRAEFMKGLGDNYRRDARCACLGRRQSAAVWKTKSDFSNSSTALCLRKSFSAFCLALLLDGFNKRAIRFFRQHFECCLPACWSSSKFCDQARLAEGHLRPAIL
jgi:hypothetical protein